MHKSFPAVLSLLALTAPVHAQTVIGSGVVQGKSIEILSNQTWRYRDGQAPLQAGCKPIKFPVQFCTTNSSWTPTKAASPEASAQFRYDDRHYGVFIIEDLGTEDGMTADYMRQAAIAILARGMGVEPAQVEVLESTSGKFDNKESSLLVYKGVISGTPIVYANTIVNDKNSTFQFVTFSIGKNFTDIDRNIHADFLSRIKIR